MVNDPPHHPSLFKPGDTRVKQVQHQLYVPTPFLYIHHSTGECKGPRSSVLNLISSKTPAIADSLPHSPSPLYQRLQLSNQQSASFIPSQYVKQYVGMEIWRILDVSFV